MKHALTLLLMFAALAGCTGNKTPRVPQEAPPPEDTTTGVSISGEATFGVVYRGD